MFQKKTIKREETGFSNIRQIKKEEHGMVIPSNSNDVRVVQCIILSEEQIQKILEERVIKNINYHEIASRFFLAKQVSPKVYMPLFYASLTEEIYTINFDSFSHGNEISMNLGRLLDKLNEYFKENEPQIQSNIQREFDIIRDERTDVKMEEREESFEGYNIIYYTEKLREFCEADSDIMGTIDNLRSHYHGTPQEMKIDGKSVLHQHVTGRTALAFFKRDETTIVIMAYGIKSDSAPNGSGGYRWDTKPK